MKGAGEFSIGGKLWPGTSKLLEEMGEVGQVLGKLIGSHGETAHYDGSDLKERLKEELADLKAAIQFFQEMNFTVDDDLAVSKRVVQKLIKFRQWQQEGK